jgi:hypothetical protein
MPSIGNSTRQVSTDSAYFINVGSLVDKIYTSPALSTPAVAVWASSFGLGDYSTNGCYASSISTAGSAILRDMGRTVVSSSVTFRRVQLVVPQGASGAAHTRTAGLTSTFGVAGGASGNGTPDYLTGYIILGFDGQNPPAPVAKFGL